MKASLDTNVILHLYRADAEAIIMHRFSDGLFVHEFIRKIEMVRHGQDILERFDADVRTGKIQIIDDEYLKKIRMYPSFLDYLNEEKILYNSTDLGEVYAISLARTLGLSTLVTDDVKEYGPHFTLMRLPDGEIIPFAFYEILFLDYLEGKATTKETASLFCHINQVSGFNWTLRSKLSIFIRRFWTNPYTSREFEWMSDFCFQYNIRFKEKLHALRLYADD